MQEDPEDTVEQLEQQSGKLGDDIEQARADWERKKESAAVPGAVPDEDPRYPRGSDSLADEDQGEEPREDG